jgi:hypothetical protein
VCNERFGTLDFRTSDWKSPSVMSIAASESGKRQEAMLLMKPSDWVRTTLGVWQLKTEKSLPNGAALELLVDGAPT